jgi:FixJ family two-component response regulator
LLTDVVMPGWRGPEVAARIEEVRPGIQVLYLSGYADVELGPEAILLQKPFPPETLAAKVDEALRVGRGATSEVLRSAPTSKR